MMLDKHGRQAELEDEDEDEEQLYRMRLVTEAEQREYDAIMAWRESSDLSSVDDCRS